MSIYPHFSDKETLGLTQDLMFKLERARVLFDAPFIITSGFREQSHNDAVGGVKDSAHVQGQAVDLRCADIGLQRKLCWALGVAGFRRIGVYSGHIHCDVSPDLPSPAFWDGGESH